MTISWISLREKSIAAYQKNCDFCRSDKPTYTCNQCQAYINGYDEAFQDLEIIMQSIKESF